MFKTGLENLTAKIALRVGPSTAIHPEAMHPQYAARVARRAAPAPAKRLALQNMDGSPVGKPAVQQAANEAAVNSRNHQIGWERANDPLMKEVYDMADKVPHGSATPAPAPKPGVGQRFGAGMARAGRGLRRGAILAGVGGAGALAVGAGLEHENQKKQDRLVYAPMNGSFSA
jgi:hypothetical protein